MLVHLLPPRPVPGVLTGSKKSSPQLLFCGILQDSMLSTFHVLYMKPLGEINHHDRMKYQYVDSTQLCIFIPGGIKLCSGCSFAVLRDYEAWMGKNRLLLNFGKTEWLWVGGSSIFRGLLCLVSDEVVLH